MNESHDHHLFNDLLKESRKEVCFHAIKIEICNIMVISFMSVVVNYITICKLSLSYNTLQFRLEYTASFNEISNFHCKKYSFNRSIPRFFLIV